MNTPSVVVYEKTAKSKSAPLIYGSLWKNIWSLAGPMFVSAILQNTQSIIDLFWIGRLGSGAVAALAISGTVLMLIFPAIMGISIGTVAMVARRIGAQQYDEASEVTSQSLIFSLFAGIIIGIIGFIFSGPVLKFMRTESYVFAMASQYLRISFAGIFTVFFLITAGSALQAAGDAKFPMKIMLLSNLLNLVMDPVFIFGFFIIPAGGVKGAAFATVLAQFISCSVILWHMKNGISGISVKYTPFSIKIPILTTLIKIGLPASFQMLSRSLMSAVLMHIVTSFGTLATAAYGIGMRFHMILLMPAFTIGNAAATLVGQNLGARQIHRASKTAFMASTTGMGILGIGSLLLFIYAKYLIGLFDKTPEVITIGREFLMIVSPFYIFSALGIILSRCLQGAGKTMAPMIITIASLWGFQIPGAMHFPKYFTTPIHGVWWAMGIAIVLNATLTTLWFMTGRWKKV